VVLVVHSPSGIFDQESAQLLQEVTDRMWKVTRVIRVSSLSNFSWVHADGEELVVEPLLEIDPQYPIDLAELREAASEAGQISQSHLRAPPSVFPALFPAWGWRTGGVRR
jgi:hypothetical protein